MAGEITRARTAARVGVAVRDLPTARTTPPRRSFEWASSSPTRMWLIGNASLFPSPRRKGRPWSLRQSRKQVDAETRLAVVPEPRKLRSAIVDAIAGEGEMDETPRRDPPQGQELGPSRDGRI